jgi:hypothetical protein
MCCNNNNDNNNNNINENDNVKYIVVPTEETLV